MINKNVKLVAGIALVGAAGYLLWQQSQKKNASGIISKAKRPSSMARGGTRVGQDSYVTIIDKCGCQEPGLPTVTVGNESGLIQCCGAGVVGRAPGQKMKKCDPGGCAAGTPAVQSSLTMEF